VYVCRCWSVIVVDKGGVNNASVFRQAAILLMCLVSCAGCNVAHQGSAGKQTSLATNQRGRQYSAEELDSMIAYLRNAIAKDSKSDELHFRLAHDLGARGDMQGFFMRWTLRYHSHRVSRYTDGL